MIRTKDQRDIYELLKFKEAMSIDQIAFELGITTDRVQIAIRYLQAQQKVGARSDTRPKTYVRAG